LIEYSGAVYTACPVVENRCYSVALFELTTTLLTNPLWGKTGFEIKGVKK
jgi:hypothetical protein